MKHLLNNMTETEKNSIREQHNGGMKLKNENFSKLVRSKLGDVKPVVSEQVAQGGKTFTFPFDVIVSENKILFPKKVKIPKGTIAKQIGNDRVLIDIKPSPLYYIPSKNDIIADAYALELNDSGQNSYVLQWADSFLGKTFNPQYEKLANEIHAVFNP